MKGGVLEEVIIDGTAVLTMNRPTVLNALSDELFDALREAFLRLDRQENVRVIILTGRGRAFCAGGDVGEMRGSSTDLTFEERVANLKRQASSVQAIQACSKVTIAAVNGLAFGAGFALSLACDFRIAARSATFTTGYIRMGFSGDCGGIYLLTNLIGAAKAKELFLLSDTIGVDEALRLGVITSSVEDRDLESRSIELARRLAAGPRVAQLYMKQNFRHTDLPLEEALAIEAVYMIRTAFTEDHGEAKRAFREKRPPIFAGR